MGTATQRTIEVHPAAANLAYSIVDKSPPGSLSKMRTALRIMEAIEGKAPPADPWPNPWQAYDEEARKLISEGGTDGEGNRIKANPHPIDPEKRVHITLSAEGAEMLAEMVEAYSRKAPTAHARALIQLEEELKREPEKEEKAPPKPKRRPVKDQPQA